MASTSASGKKITGHLKRIIGNPVGHFIALYDTNVSIGRTTRSDVCIQDPNVSRNHCTLNYSTDGWFITDLGGVNGTYLDGDKLTPHVPHLLKDGLGIYLGPPAEAPVAFVFIKSKVKEEAAKTDLEHLKNENNKKSDNQLGSEKEAAKTDLEHLKNKNNKKTEKQSGSDKLTLKRRVKASNHSTGSKKHASSTSSNLPVSSRNTSNLPESSEYHTDRGYSGADSDISISSLDSLRTRIRKINSDRKTKSRSSKIDTVLTSSSTAPSSRPQTYIPPFDSVPSTSSAHEINLPSASSGVSKKLLKKENSKKTQANIFKELDAFFADGSDSLPENVNTSEDSESLLKEADLPSASTEPDSNVAELKKRMADLNEQLKEAQSKLMQENSEQKQKLNQLIKESTNKTESSEKLGEMIEEELICNICTEVFIKATTLGCSHTYCEHCIKEWKKKQKRCPICRELISSETRVLIMDNFIDKVVAKLGKEYQDKRKEVIAAREQANTKVKVKKIKRRKSSSRRNPMRSRVLARENPETLRQLRLNLLTDMPYSVIDIASSENLTVDGMYNICYICGSGHFANYCPHR